MKVLTPLEIPQGAVNGYVLTSDATGKSAWAAPAGGTTLYFGTADPTAADGANGTLWLNITTGTFWGPKASGAWPGSPFGRIVTDAMTYAQLSSGGV